MTDAKVDREHYIQLRNKYKTLIREKKDSCYKSICQSLISNLNNSCFFWPLIRRATFRRTMPATIDLETWKTYFQTLFQIDDHTSGRVHMIGERENAVYIQELDAPIREEEVKLAITKLSSGKAPGLDETPGDYLKLASLQILPFLTELFRVLYEQQYFPRSWSQSIIIPLHKAGDRSSSDSYRGISLLSAISKVFTSVLTNRLRNWVEDENKLCEE